MEANLCRDTFERLLDDECKLLTQLETLLQTEHRHLSGNDVDALEQAGKARQACIGELLHIEDERRSLCRALGKTADPQGLEQLLKWCDPTNSLHPRWAKRGKLAQRCRESNDRNGVLVAARLKRVEEMLSVITGRDRSQMTYGPQVNAYGQTPVGRMIRSEA